MSSNFDAVLPVINQLQDIFTVTGASLEAGSGHESTSSLVLELPQIAAIGSQSSGKSSVLESVVGRDFLPRGSGIVTRRPLVLQLVNTSSDSREVGEFLHLPGKQFTDFSEIRDEIQRETDRLTGTNKGISRVPINLKVSSPHVVDLTLVDLPGITRVPVGDQPDDIEDQIRMMVLEFIARPNCIILAVTAANTDVANSDALKLARDVDPRGLRTLGVLTKLDLMDRGTDCMDVLQGHVVPLKLGYVPVVNRSQHDIDQGTAMDQAAQAEAQFFADHPVYRRLRDRSGTRYLAKTLNKLLLDHVRAFLPELRTRIGTMLTEAELELHQLGPSFGSDDQGSRSVMLLDIITKCSNRFRQTVWGDQPGSGSSSSSGGGGSGVTSTTAHFSADRSAMLREQTEKAAKELGTGARINFIFNDVFLTHLMEMAPLSGITDSAIKTTLHNAAGTKPALFIAEDAFELLIRKQISMLRTPALQCVDLVHEELRAAVAHLDLPELDRFDRLRDAIVDELRGHLQLHADRAKTMISHLLDCELAFINIHHPDFAGADEVTSRMLKESMKKKHQDGAADDQDDQQRQQDDRATKKEPAPSGGGGSWWRSKQATGGRSSKQPSTAASLSSAAAGSSFKSSSAPAAAGSTDRLRKVPTQIKAGSYKTNKEIFEIDVIMTDFVPKSVMHFLVQESQSDVQTKLIHALYNEAKMAELMDESPIVQAKRKDLAELVAALKKAKSVLGSLGASARSKAIELTSDGSGSSLLFTTAMARSSSSSSTYYPSSVSDRKSPRFAADAAKEMDFAPKTPSSNTYYSSSASDKKSPRFAADAAAEEMDFAPKTTEPQQPEDQKLSPPPVAKESSSPRSNPFFSSPSSSSTTTATEASVPPKKQPGLASAFKMQQDSANKLKERRRY